MDLWKFQATTGRAVTEPWFIFGQACLILQFDFSFMSSVSIDSVSNTFVSVWEASTVVQYLVAVVLYL